MFSRLLLALAAFAWSPAQALDIRFERVADNVYAYIGDTGPRSVSNEALNANIGLIVSPSGAVLIDSGATARSAERIHEAVRQVTTQPLRWVINTGTQDHRWLGNGYFRAQGAELIAHKNGLADMRSRGGEQLTVLRSLLGDAMAGTEPVLPTRVIDGEVTRLELGGTILELHHRGGGHTPGDTMVWLPQQRVLFTGDIVYVDRLLAVLPISSTRQWLASLQEVETLKPLHVVPGHGRVTDVAKALEQTQEYLKALRAHARRAVDQGVDPSTAARTFDGRRWEALVNAAELMPGNTSRVYLEVELE